MGFAGQPGCMGAMDLLRLELTGGRGRVETAPGALIFWEVRLR